MIHIRQIYGAELISLLEGVQSDRQRDAFAAMLALNPGKVKNKTKNLQKELCPDHLMSPHVLNHLKRKTPDYGFGGLSRLNFSILNK